MPRKHQRLRNQLLRWLLVPLFALLLIDTFVSYRVALRFAERAYDGTLVEIAREVSLHLRMAEDRVVFELPAESIKLLVGDPVDKVYFEVSAGGRLLAGTPIPNGAAAGAGGLGKEILYDGRIEGAPVRAVQLQFAEDRASGRPPTVIRVAETKLKRNSLAREILLSVILPQILLIVAAGLLVWGGVVRGLAPLARLQRTIALRSNRDFSPVRIEGVPGEVRPLLDAINALLERLESMLTLQSRFISDAAHQLKTPIAVLRTQLELALRENDAARMRRAVEDSDAALERLSRLVSQLLSLARNEPQAAKAAAMEPLDLNDLMLAAATDWVTEALKKKIDLGFEPSAAPALIRGDPGRLRELFDNLIDNAVRYSREGGRVTVRVSSVPSPTVDINDDGATIPAGERVRIFDRFHRLLGSSREGSGLGLAIAREIASIHGAEITLREDVDGIGNTFSVSFPRRVKE